MVLIAISIIYFADTAAELSGFFPGHQAGSAHHHTKHGIVAAAVGLAAFIGAWISTGSKSTSGSS